MSLNKILPIKPPALRPNARIGVVAPAGAFDRGALSQGVELIKTMGFEIQLPEGLFEVHGYLAGDDQHRADQLQAMFCDDGVDAIMCARGGFGTLRILSLIDYDLIAAHPKPFIGFSDISALHHALYQKAGLVTFHGPMVCTMRKSDKQSQVAWQHMLSADQPLSVFAHDKCVVRTGRAEGVLVGGNLTTLCHLLGTPYAPSYRDCILFLEEIGEAVYRIDRMLTQMKLAGCFERVAGVVLGTFKGCGQAEEIKGLVAHIFEDYEAPILTGFAVGHGRRNLTLPLGVTVRLDADRGELICLESPVVH